MITALALAIDTGVVAGGLAWCQAVCRWLANNPTSK